MMRLPTSVTFVLLAVATASVAALPRGNANLQTRATESLDWTANDSDLIVRARLVMVVIRVDPVTRRDDWEEATLRVYETIKGQPVTQDLKVLRSTRNVGHFGWPEAPCLYFLVAGRRATWLNSPDFLENRFLLVDPALRTKSLETPFRRAPRGSSDEGAPSRAEWVVGSSALQVYTADLRRLTDPEDVLQATREAVARQARELAAAPPGTRFRPALKAFSDNLLPEDRRHNYGWDILLTVPADDDWRQSARRELARGRYVTWLDKLADPYYRNPATEAFVFDALADPWGAPGVADPYHWPRRRLDDFHVLDHLNRRDALEVLQQWGMPVVRPDSTSPLLPRLPVRPSFGVWLGVAALLLAPWLLGRRGPGTVGRFVAWTCLLLAAAGGASWRRSLATYDSAVWQTRAAEHELSSYAGQLRYLLLTDGTAGAAHEPRRLAHASASLARPDLVPAHTNYLLPDHLLSRWGLAWSQGLTPPVAGHHWPPTAANARRFQFVTLPYPWLIGALLFYPALRGIKALARYFRTRRRAARKQCVACGYDLRHAPARCPECGGRTALIVAAVSPAPGEPVMP